MKDNYTRVTSILYPFSGLSKVDPHILKNAADRGTKVHEICDALMNELGIFEMDDNISGYITSFSSWLTGKTFIKKPDRFYCDKLMITGEVDGIYKEGKDLVLFDIKTPVKESQTWELQGSAYSYLAKLAGYDIKRIEFIKLDKKGNEPVVFTYKENMELFLKCYDLYKIFFKNMDKQNPCELL